MFAVAKSNETGLNWLGEGSAVGFFDRFRSRRPGTGRRATSADTDHLRDWAARRRGVEGFLEPRTFVTETTLLLIAHDGEWTRRRVASPSAAGRFTKQLGIPLYEVAKVGYPQRMRDYQARQRILRRRAQRAADERP
ncbi:oxidoreductase [Saccharopolyspora sp. ID03-671]